MIIRFTATELYQILHYASVIHETKRINSDAGAVTNMRYAKDIDDFSMHLIGGMGEAAFCKAVNIPYHVEVGKYGDDGNDVDYMGFDVQIKTTSKSHGDNGMLYVNDIEKVPSYILVAAEVVGPASVRLIGGISKSKFKSLMFKHDFGYGERDCVYHRDLQPIEKLVEWVDAQIPL